MGRNDSRAVTVAQAGQVEPDAKAMQEAAAFAYVQRQLEARKDQLAKLLGESVDVDRYLTVALQAIQKTPALLSCSVLSILSGIRTAAQYALEVGGPLSDASLIPEQGEARLQIEYRGLRKIALRDPDVIKVDAEVVYEHDVFDLQLGDDPRIHHKPLLDGDRGKYRGAYGFAKLRSGEIVPMWLSIAELDKRRDISRSYRAGGDSPWRSWPAEMYRKTMLAALIRSKLRLDPIARELVQLAEDTDPSLAGVPIRAAVKPVAQLDSPAARARALLAGDTAAADPVAAEADSGQAATEPAAAVETSTEAAPEAQRPSVAVEEGQATQACGDPSPYDADDACGKPIGHVSGKGSGAKIHAGARATWEEGTKG
jgi:phage RecT family recombinase